MSLLESVSARLPRPRWTGKTIALACAVAIAGSFLWWPDFTLDALVFSLTGMVSVSPIVLPGILLAAWITASGASAKVATILQDRMAFAIVGAALIGASIPVCGVTVLPMMAGLLAARVPLAPVMTFWLASPITGPAMMSATVATLGWEFGIGKMIAAIALGLFGGAVTALMSKRDWVLSPLRDNEIVRSIGGGCGTCGPSAFEPWFWRESDRRAVFWKDCISITRLIVLVLFPAFTAEFMLNAWLEPGSLTAYIGEDNPLAVPFAVQVGAPAYIDGYAALPLTRALLESGMSPAAAMAFLVSGGVVSVWGAMAIFPVLRLKAFLLYLALATVGSMLAGWGFGALV